MQLHLDVTTKLLVLQTDQGRNSIPSSLSARILCELPVVYVCRCGRSTALSTSSATLRAACGMPLWRRRLARSAISAAGYPPPSTASTREHESASICT